MNIQDWINNHKNLVLTIILIGMIGLMLIPTPVEPKKECKQFHIEDKVFNEFTSECFGYSYSPVVYNDMSKPTLE